MVDETESGSAPYLIGEEQGIWAIYKPADLAVHPTAEGQPHLLTWIESADVPSDLRPMHRLDLATSGVVLCGNDPAVKKQVEAWFSERVIKKTYRALVVGRTRNEGVIRRKIPSGKKRGVKVDAVTHWRRLSWCGPASYLEVKPETGRKHQIRQHLAGLGFPIVGDKRYGPRRFRPIPGFPNRMWLHALRLTLPEGIEFEAPLPANLEAHLALLAEVEARREARTEE